MTRRIPIVPDRGVLTDTLVVALTAALDDDPAILVGDGMAPVEGGWPKGEPGEGDFVPYIVLTCGSWRPAAGLTLAPAGDAWSASYRVGSYGGQREHADYVADRVHQCWPRMQLDPMTLGHGGEWGFASWDIAEMGEVVRNDQIQPSMWSTTSALTLLVTRKHLRL